MSESSKRTYERAKVVGYNANLKKKMVTIFNEAKYRAAVTAGDLPDDLTETVFKGNGAAKRAVWSIPILAPTAKERCGYPTQKPLALLNTIIRGSSNPGDRVLDPFCGCATTLISAEKNGREWTGVDLSPKAVKLVKMRLEQEMNKDKLKLIKVIARDDNPIRTDVGEVDDYRTNKNNLYGEQEGNCSGCKVHFPFRIMTVDHIVPKSKGGTDHPDNLQLLCSACNSTKGTGTQANLIRKLKKTGIID